MELPVLTFPSKVWKIRYIEPYHSIQDPKDTMYFTLLHFGGFMENPLSSNLGQYIRDLARKLKCGYLAVVTKEINGLGPKAELENLEFSEILDVIMKTLRNDKFKFGPNHKLIIIGFSYGGWMGLCIAALMEEMGEWLGGALLLAPAVGCFLPFYMDQLLRLKSMPGRADQVNQLANRQVVRLDGAFGPIANFPMSYPFMESTWGYHLERLNLSNLTKPVSLIIGEQDPRVTVREVEALYEKLPAGNKRIVKVDGLEHTSFEDASVFASVVRPEIERLAQEVLPNLASKDNEDLEGMDIQSWEMNRKPNKKKALLYLTTGRTFVENNLARGYEQEMKDYENEVNETETWEINPQVHEFDLLPAQPETKPQPEDRMIE